MTTPFHLSRVLTLSFGGACAAFLLCNAPRAALGADGKVEFPAPSSHTSFKQRVGVTDVEVDYSRPNKNDREIFGGLVPFDKVWRTGANNATRVTFSGPVKLGGKEIPAGTYGLYTIPGKSEWKVIVSKDSKAWGAYTYKEENDVVRISAKPLTVPIELETFTIGFDAVKENSAEFYLAWDNQIVIVPLTVDTVTEVKADIARVAGTPDATPQFYAQAANYYLSHDLDLNKALEWMDTAIKATPDAYFYYGRKAGIQAKLGDKAGALASAQKALELAKSQPKDADEETIASLAKQVESLK